MSARNDRRQLKKRVEAAFAAHPCGACTACCTVKEVSSIHKPDHTPCKHLGVSRTSLTAPPRERCTIYAKRPTQCRDYFCAYRYGLVFDNERFRPDQLGIVFDVGERPPPGVNMMLVAREVTPGAIEERMQELHEITSQGCVIYLVQGDRRRFLGPEEQVKICIDFARRSLPLAVPRD